MRPCKHVLAFTTSHLQRVYTDTYACPRLPHVLCVHAPTHAPPHLHPLSPSLTFAFPTLPLHYSLSAGLVYPPSSPLSKDPIFLDHFTCTQIPRPCQQIAIHDASHSRHPQPLVHGSLRGTFSQFLILISQASPTKPPSTRPTSGRQDPFYGHKQISKLCAKFITHLFACSEYPPLSLLFHSYALHRTQLHLSVTFAALVLLQRLKARFPTAWGSSGHRLFISAFMIASKVICDYTYSNKSWTIVTQGIFQLSEINQMEREMCQYLEWELNIDPVTLREFEDTVRKDFRSPSRHHRNLVFLAPHPFMIHSPAPISPSHRTRRHHPHHRRHHPKRP
ncbi:hypothetical protein J3R83DRAFT_9552 [Lanmaoa asiatica]|nr:hypothetical protein J3R83DRAFT_9552 [Lanmaoa asiatica]